MAILMRRGADADFDASKIQSGELAVTTDGTEKIYVGFAKGKAKELVKKETFEAEIGQLSEQIADLKENGTGGGTEQKKFDDLENIIVHEEISCPFKLENGTLVGTTGIPADNPNWVRTTDFLNNDYLGKIVAKCNSNKVAIYSYEYREDKSFIHRKNAPTPVSPECKYVKFAFYSTSIPQEEISQYCDIVYRGENPTTHWLEQSSGYSPESAMSQKATTYEIDTVARAIVENNFEVTPTWEDGISIADGGVIGRVANSIASDFIRILPFGEFVFENIGKSVTIRLVEYDKDKNFIARQAVTEKRLTIQNGDCAFVKVSAEYAVGVYENVNEMKPFLKVYYICDIFPNIIHFNPNAETIKSINHRGYNSVAPENTLPAFRLSKRHGFDIAECDVAKTKDGVLVLLHDSTINRTARNLDGTEIATELNINDLDYAELANYDFGIWKNPVYAGTKIPTFEEFIRLCRDINLCPYIELKHAGNYTAEDIQYMKNIVYTYGMENKTSYISFNVNFLQLVRESDKNARLGLLISADGVTESNFEKFIRLVNKRTSSFVDVSTAYITDELIARCISLGIAVEVYCPNTENEMLALDSRVSGVTSDTLVASEVIRNANLGNPDTGVI